MIGHNHNKEIPKNPQASEIQLVGDNSNLTEVQEIPDEEFSVPHPNHYKKWFEFLDRIDLRRHLSDVENVLKQKIHIGILPEGTRKKTNEGIGKFGISCGVLASNEGVPIIPICHNSGLFWKNKKFNK